MKKALLFINGTPPENFPDLEQYTLIACTDGAFHYLKQKSFPLQKLDFISGDFDSHSGADEEVYDEKFIYTPDQEKTDFDKALEIIQKKGFSKVDVLGGSGGEMDHFLGNLTVAYRFRDQMEIIFSDEFSEYFFIPGNFEIENVKGKMISLYPFPSAENIITQGLNWQLQNENLNMVSRIGTRNFAVENRISIKYSKGDLLVFIGDHYL